MLTLAREFVHSIEHFCLIWLVCVFLAAWLTCKGCRKFRGAVSVRRFHRNEAGAAYSLSFVMVLPFYVLLLAIIFETTFIFLAKMGTMYASHSAARSAAVHTTVNFLPERKEKGDIPPAAWDYAQNAAVQAMTPYTRGLFGDDDIVKDELPKAKKYREAFREYLEMNGKKECKLLDSYIEKKYKYANQAVSVDLRLDPKSGTKPWNQELEVTMKYESPALLPYVGRLLGAKKSVKNPKLTVYILETKTSLANECPKNDTGSLGIAYMK